MSKVSLNNLTFSQLADTLNWLPAFRSKQVFKWLSIGTQSFDDMTNLSKDLRATLSNKYNLCTAKIITKLASKTDGTIKYLIGLNDGNCVESVFMRYAHGNSVCISTQVGCNMGCSFCASGKNGKVRNLTAAEMLLQISLIEQDNAHLLDENHTRVISNIVLMGIGEPLDNYENVLNFLEIINHPDGFNISHRNISLSTCGLVDKIRDLADLHMQITLSVSLHATSNEVRSNIMPVNKRYPIDELLKACDYYTNATSRRISYEYALIDGVNDTADDAKVLADLMQNRLAHVNLIPVNAIKDGAYAPSPNVKKFKDILTKNGITATVRRTLGADIAAACGQLRNNAEQM
ncbi:MAG: 23S rRNA (adenine(2503)-C(2))-methyltransferase RlmN [Clostridiales bacterium]|jgi:23S rRNA (adenine2503-C2)-methyltransferase|nr:23S rRNA (adenine(2503)-C(2))-methyltransferase RlmN [Clostridiales bacterium]